MAVHAVKEVDGVASTRTVCERTIPPGDEVQDTFEEPGRRVMDGCPICCSTLGLEALER